MKSKLKFFYPKVKNFAEAKTVGQTYSTTNFKMFKTFKFNRGCDNGIEPKRLNEFIKLYIALIKNLPELQYLTGIIHVYVNLKGFVVDGHHKLELHKLYGIPVNFVILAEKKFNEGTDIEIMAAIANFNAKTSKWDGVAHFKTALQFREPLALAIRELKAIYETKYGFKKNLLTPSRIFVLLTEERKGLSSQSKNVEDYCKSELVEVMSTNKFKNEFDFVCAVLKYVTDWNKTYKNIADITPFFIIRHIMPMIWDNELNMKKFYHNMTKTGFMKVSNTMGGIGAWVEEITSKRTKKDEIYTSWM